MVRLPRNEKQTHRLNSRLQTGPSGLTLTMTMTLTLNFQGQISNWIYLNKKWCNCQETKSKHIAWSQDLKCDHQVWPWPCPWPWIFKVKYGIGYQALTTPGKIRLPIGQPAGKYQVSPIKSQVAPLLPNVIINNTVYDDFVTHSKIKCNINGIRSVENNEKKLHFGKTLIFRTLRTKYVYLHIAGMYLVFDF